MLKLSKKRNSESKNPYCKHWKIVKYQVLARMWGVRDVYRALLSVVAIAQRSVFTEIVTQPLCATGLQHHLEHISQKKDGICP